MTNTLYLPELREMLAEGDDDALRQFCMELHPARTAEFMEGLQPPETWRVLLCADPALRAEIFRYFEHDKQIAIIENEDRGQVAELAAELAPDDRVDLLQDVEQQVVDELLPRLPAEERRDTLRLQAYPEGVAGAVMTTEAAQLGKTLTVSQALAELSRQAGELETIYYLYVVDDTDHLHGVVSARQLVSAMGRPDTPLGDLMETDLVSCHVMDDQEDVAKKVARYNLLAIPVVDDERRMLGIITHDDVIDVLREEATEDAHMIAAVAPLEVGYLKTRILTLAQKRVFWLAFLFFAELVTAFALRNYEDRLHRWTWLVFFIPLIMSSGGNSGGQSAALIIRALATGDISLRDWSSIVWREFRTGILLGAFLGVVGYLAALLGYAASIPLAPDPLSALVVPITLLLIVVWGTLSGSFLPLLFQRLGLDPALMSNPFVAGLNDIVGIVIYLNLAYGLLTLIGTPGG